MYIEYCGSLCGCLDGWVSVRVCECLVISESSYLGHFWSDWPGILGVGLEHSWVCMNGVQLL